MVLLFAVTIFVGSALLFLLQPMFARMVLPLLGGSPSVWNTAMVFYQAALLVGYAYAHLGTRRIRPHRHALLHLGILLLPLLVLPVTIPAGGAPPTESNPIPWLLGLMTVAIGLPFFATATMSPVLQYWFSQSGHPRAADPYFLYSASNLGSMIALLSYPTVIESRLTVGGQAQLWTWAYVGFLVLAALCAGCVWRARSATAPLPAADPEAGRPTAFIPPVTPGRRLRWVALSAVPSSLMLGVTTYLSSEIAVVPLLWVIPLAIYLLTFVLAFRPGLPAALPQLVRVFCILIVALVVAINMRATQPLVWLMLLHLVVFAVGALLCHGRLAADRPPAAGLTGFYLWIAVGGVLGGIFNALLAPVLFNNLIEYPLALVLAAFLGTSFSGRLFPQRLQFGDWAWPLAIAGLTVALARGVPALRFESIHAIAAIIFGLPALGCFLLSRQPLRFALGLAALLLAANVYQGEEGKVLHTERSFFGLHRVTLDPVRNFHFLVHGRTLHGTQSLDPDRRLEPLAYYHRTGPAGQVLASYGRDPASHIGVIGLGAGALASYALPGQSWTFFEIDPVVAKLARDERYFTFLRDSPARLRIVMGDARLSLVHESAGQFDVLLIDAFSSDAIPAHLITREALALYREKLAPNGILAFHISNRHLDLEPVLATLARDASLIARLRDDTSLPDRESDLGKSGSLWLVMARTTQDLSALAGDPRWQPARDTNHPVWTDDYSSLLSILKSR